MSTFVIFIRGFIRKIRNFSQNIVQVKICLFSLLWFIISDRGVLLVPIFSLPTRELRANDCVQCLPMAFHHIVLGLSLNSFWSFYTYFIPILYLLYLLLFCLNLKSYAKSWGELRINKYIVVIWTCISKLVFPVFKTCGIMSHFTE